VQRVDYLMPSIPSTLLNCEEHYCPPSSVPHCDCCGASLHAHHWQLHDGRRQCGGCHRTAIYDFALAQTLFAETAAGIRAQLGFSLNVGVEFRLVDAPALQALRSQDTNPQQTKERTLGLYHRQGRLRVIYMLYGLPRLLFRTTVAHEFAHAWQGEHCPLLTDQALREGFAEWVAYRHLIWLGATKAAQLMLTAPHPYRPLLAQVLTLEEQFGIPGLIDYIRRFE